MMNFILALFTIHTDFAERWAVNFQDPASDWMCAIIELHDRIIFYLVIILVVVVWFLTSGLTNKDHMANLHHGNVIELFWTLSPAGILWAIGLPSLRL
jgi:cytochrome c oxidase subunit 2